MKRDADFNGGFKHRPDLYTPDDYLADRRRVPGPAPPVPVAFSFFIGFFIGLLVMIPVWTIVVVLAWRFL